MSQCGCSAKEVSSKEVKSSLMNQVEGAKVVVVDLLFLDLSVCTRCQSTETSLNDSLDSVLELLGNIGYQVQLNKIHIETKEQAVSHRFISSPTIRINGCDIQMEVKESHCSTCSSLTDDASVDCRVWSYKDVDYSSPPKEMIVDAILKDIYSPKEESLVMGEYTLPYNLEEYFKKKNKLCASVATECASGCC